MMEKNFGKVLFAKFVIDRATERPKGTAFVKFASEESANKCIAESVLTGANSAKGNTPKIVNLIVFESVNSFYEKLYCMIILPDDNFPNYLSWLIKAGNLV